MRFTGNRADPARRVRACLALVFFVTVGVAGAASPVHGQAPAGAQPQRQPPPVWLDVSSVPIVRHAGLFASAARAANVLVDAGARKLAGPAIRRPGAKGIAFRIAKLYLADLPIASLGHVFSHEYGHAGRIAERGASYSMRITHWPWPIPLSGAEIWSPDLWSLAPVDELPLIAGGWDGSAALADLSSDRIHAADTARYFDVLLYVFARTDQSLYILSDLSPSRTSSPTSDPADVTNYLSVFLQRRGRFEWSDVQAMARSVRRGAVWNLVDYSIWGNAGSTVLHYLVRGNPDVPVAWLRAGPVRLSPGLRYTLTPRGPERQVGAVFAVGGVRGRGYVRWSEPDLRQAGTEVVSSGRLAGGGFSARLPSRGRLEPAVAVDIWRDTNRRAAGRAEASIMLPLAARFSLRAGGGYKTGGYLAGFPERGGAYLQCGIGLTRGGRRGPD